LIREKIPDKIRLFEITAVLITGAGKFILMDWLEWRLIYTSCAILFWITYIIIRYRQDKHILKYWGFKREDFTTVLIRLLPFALPAVLLFFLIGYLRNTIILSWHIIPVLILYPAWGIIQQFLVVGLVAGNLQDMDGKKPPRWQIIGLTSILFAAVHYPYWWLVGGTFLLALIYTTIYLSRRNIFALGLLHGWLGAFFFYTVMNRDPWIEMFRNFI
jgi:membrane protease YdiL (CAAX protease family)